ncbi:2-aminoethylphosphonate aminotransferase [Pandoraea nosoerga]|uniref:2-aminoethylphosphonate--pyruvate transaminase n=1 Tax=Pandoraea nosoerga TaxID=2508296 RepID=A0A5E4VZY3_9BURK|nr:2-aminoethylphosphonate aminotransferase [Pandoraea nosoerga]MBN4666222.1 2-aminoethylphosphonate aminotransferase [Pandoraea nosoerga]MBN4676277.1 2-aminoethylphosphonate aminotransferase [Pandoraea nosoerga]MBN4681314.1 2-aminoethylphosphonate aminotransferase [Pandoraea nosoerga]MBN4745389.1 2-aminoethylphosphonate aminotransferase [Pandoraea nosoerga]VVE17016.1 2-aminoethylphosphonate aminotransferase [Pandoraea nosoerga]
MLLLNPGPVTLTERVRKSLLQPDLCHREPEFFDLQDEARARLISVYGLDPDVWTPVLMTGSGTAAVESMTAGLVPEGGRLLIVENGVYGERISQIARQYRIDHDVIHFEWMQAPDLAQVVARLDAAGDRPYTNVAIIHHETTTGRLNDLAGIANACRERGIDLLVDGVSSFAAEAIDFDAPGIAAVAATANKCLHGVPGVSFVLVRKRALARAASRTYYLDIGRLAKLQAERNTPFTPSVHAYYALVEALRELEDAGGWEKRHAHYGALAEQARAGLAALGIDSVLPPAESSVVLRAYKLPAGVDYPRLHDWLKADGFVIYAGQGGLSSTLFRISTMGNLATADIDRLLASFARLVQ